MHCFLKKLKEWEVGGRVYCVYEKRPRRETRQKQAQSENASYYALKNTTWEQNWRGADEIQELLLEAPPHPPHGTGKAPVSRFPSLLHCRAPWMPRNIYSGADKEQGLIISTPNFPPIEEWKKNSSLLWTLDEQEHGFTKYLTPRVNTTHSEMLLSNTISCQTVISREGIQTPSSGVFVSRSLSRLVSYLFIYFFINTHTHKTLTKQGVLQEHFKEQGYEGRKQQTQQ